MKTLSITLISFILIFGGFLFISGCASVKYERMEYNDKGSLIKVERGHYSRLGDQKVKSIIGWDGAATIEGQEATSELGKNIVEGAVEGLKHF